MYSDIVKEHFANPRNLGVLEDADVVVRVGDPGCGDALLFYLKIEGDVLKDVRYKIFGCAAAIATSSVASEMAKGRRLDEVLRMTDEDVTEALGGLPEEKKHCSNMAARALHTAIERYRRKRPPQ